MPNNTTNTNGEKVSHTSNFHCPVCGGYDEMPRGKGERCHGFTRRKPEGVLVFCSREEHANGPTFKKLVESGGNTLFEHWIPKDGQPPPRRKPSERPPTNITKRSLYDYPLADGGKHLRAVRMDLDHGGKRFAVEHWTGVEWKSGQGDKTPVLYNLPALINAPADETIFIAEGEKCADALKKLGLTATTNIYGAGKWRDEYAEALTGRQVVIFPDSDEPGRKHAAQVAQSLAGKAASVRVIELPNLPAKGDVTDWIEAGGNREHLDDIIDAAPEWTPPAAAAPSREDPEEPSSGGEGKAIEGQSAAERATSILMTIARREARFIVSTEDRRMYAVVGEGKEQKVFEMEMQGFAGWLRRRYRNVTGRAYVSGDAVSAAITNLMDDCRVEGEPEDVFLRVGEKNGNIYLDMGELKSSRAIEIAPDGWRIVDPPPCLFRRSAKMKPLPEPAASNPKRAAERIWHLRDFINVDIDDDFRLAVAWILAGFRTGLPFPHIIIEGEAGSGKTSAARALRAFLDPSSSPSTSAPKCEEDLMVSARLGHVLSFNNIGSTTEWLSNAICRLSDEGGFARRKMWTGLEEEVINRICPVILNGIAGVANRADLLDRAVKLQLHPWGDKYLDKRVVTESLDALKGEIFAGILDAACLALREFKNVTLPRTPRMADFATWATAAEELIGFEPGGFLKAYEANRGGMNQNAIEDTPLAAAIQEIMEGQDEYRKTPTELLHDLESLNSVTDAIKRTKEWPNGASALSRALSKIAPMLRHIGIECERAQDSQKKRVIILTKDSKIAVSTVEPSPETHHAQHNQHVTPKTVNPDQGDGRDGNPHSAPQTPNLPSLSKDIVFAEHTYGGDGRDGRDGKSVISGAQDVKLNSVDWEEI